MELDKIISISGKPGLFKIVGEMKNGVVVEELAGGKRFPAMATQQVSTLSDITIYTDEEDGMPLGDVLSKMKEKLGEADAPDPKSDPEELKKFFAEVLPDYDDERVYVSDIKKVVRWYNALNSAGLVTVEKKKEEKKEEGEKEEGEKEAEKVEKKTDKATTSAKEKTEKKVKKAAKKTDEAEVEAEKEETPAEKKTKKKAKEEAAPSEDDTAEE